MGDFIYGRSREFDFFQLVADGSIPGCSVIEKFGENPEVESGTTPEDVWDYGGLYVFSSVADIDRLSSSSAADTQDVLIIGLDEGWNEVTQVVTLNGQTPVSLSTSLVRVYRMVNIGSVDMAGEVYCFVNGGVTDGVPDNSSDVRAGIRGGNNQTLMCVYTVPNGKTGYFWGGYVAVSRAGVQPANVDFSWRARAYGGVFTVASRISCVSVGSSTWNYTYKAPVRLPARTDVIIRCESVSNDCGVAGGFTVLLKDD